MARSRRFFQNRTTVCCVVVAAIRAVVVSVNCVAVERLRPGRTTRSLEASLEYMRLLDYGTNASGAASWVLCRQEQTAKPPAAEQANPCRAHIEQADRQGIADTPHGALSEEVHWSGAFFGRFDN